MNKKCLVCAEQFEDNDPRWPGSVCCSSCGGILIWLFGGEILTLIPVGILIDHHFKSRFVLFLFLLPPLAVSMAIIRRIVRLRGMLGLFAICAYHIIALLPLLLIIWGVYITHAWSFYYDFLFGSVIPNEAGNGNVGNYHSARLQAAQGLEYIFGLMGFVMLPIVAAILFIFWYYYRFVPKLMKTLEIARFFRK